jgi:hypothetical protein
LSWSARKRFHEAPVVKRLTVEAFDSRDNVTACALTASGGVKVARDASDASGHFFL